MTDNPDAPTCPGPDPRPGTPSIEVPNGACDTHVHVFDGSRYSYQANRGYTPPDAPHTALRDMHRKLGIERAVIVQASVHGTDNRAVVETVARDPARLRGVCAVGEDVSDEELARLDGAGIRGIRVNLVDRGGMPFSSLDALGDMARRIAPMGWHIELLVHVHEQAGFTDFVRSLEVPVVIGHIGYVKTDAGIGHSRFRAFLALLREGHGWVKLSGPYRNSLREAPPYDDVAPFARAVVEAAPDRVVWGSDWPHVIHYRKMPNDADLIACLADWAPDPELRKRILVDNPMRLYGFNDRRPEQ